MHYIWSVEFKESTISNDTLRDFDCYPHYMRTCREYDRIVFIRIAGLSVRLYITCVLGNEYKWKRVYLHDPCTKRDRVFVKAQKAASYRVNMPCLSCLYPIFLQYTTESTSPEDTSNEVKSSNNLCYMNHLHNVPYTASRPSFLEVIRLSRQINWLKIEINFKFAAMAFDFKWKIQLILT